MENPHVCRFLHTRAGRKAANSAGRNAQNQDGDVIGAAAFQRHAQELGAGFRWRISLCDLREIAFWDQAPESVRAKNQNVGFLEFDRLFRNMRDNVAARSQCGRKDVALWVRLGILGADDSVFDQTPDIRMIAGQARENAFADKVKPAVADVSEIEIVVNDRERGTGGPHAVKLRMLESVALNRIVSRLEGRTESLLGITVELAIVLVPNGLDGETAGFLSAFIASHAVGDDGKTPLPIEFGGGFGFPIEIGVFVVRALEAYVG